MKRGSILAVILLSLVSIAHLLRLVFGVELQANGVEIPLWLSALGFLVPGSIALMLWRESR
jgi:membrane protein CcdC involved in cytochrome C biogenesis